MTNFIYQNMLACMMIVFCISPLMNIYYISKNAKSSRQRTTIRKLGFFVYIGLLLFVIVSNQTILHEISINCIFIIICVSPLVNIYYIAKSINSRAKKISFVLIGLVGYVVLWRLIYLTLFVIVDPF